MEQLDLLEELSWTISVGSLCALGKTAPNPVLSTLKYFREEYEAHINDKCCPAGVCSDLIHFVIDPDLCIECGECITECPHQAISDEAGYKIDDELCQKCGICEEVCPTDAISKNGRL